MLLYAHHDVQPVGDMNLWKTDPFTPEMIDGRLFGRGSGDNKSGVVVHYNVIKQLIDELPVNIKVFIEGEEEIGSPTMSLFIEQNREALEADVIVIADSGNVKILDLFRAKTGWFGFFWLLFDFIRMKNSN